MVKIKFTAQGANALIGGFGPGDKANVGEALAKHLVEEARVAVYNQPGDLVKPKKAAAKKAKAPSPTETPVAEGDGVASAAAVPPAPTFAAAGAAPEVPTGD